MPTPALLAIALVLGLVVLLPARRLQLAGFRGRSIGAYAAFLWALAFVLAIRPIAARFLIPILVIAYLAPFVVAPARMARMLARGRGGHHEPAPPPMKNVTPPDERVAPGGSEGPGGPGGPK
ncbi:MAG: hypothetical protein QOC97_294 [Chloroflexota bacterium]|jgi:hypothetical protein|nr:hypothetical protein [Chloroflexota bacterium]